MKHRKGCRIFVKDVLIKIPTLLSQNVPLQGVIADAKHECNWVTFAGSVCVHVSACLRLEGGYFICIASSQGNNLNFSLLLLKWNQLIMFYKWGLPHGAGSMGVCVCVLCRLPGDLPSWYELVLIMTSELLLKKQKMLLFLLWTRVTSYALLQPAVICSLTWQNSIFKDTFRDTYVHELHVSLGSCRLIQYFNSYGNLHLLSFWDPDPLKKYTQTALQLLEWLWCLRLKDQPFTDWVPFLLTHKRLFCHINHYEGYNFRLHHSNWASTKCSKH